MGDTGENKEQTRKKCTSCGKLKNMTRHYFISNNEFHAANGYRHPVCKDCLKQDLDFNNQESLCSILRELNRPFIYDTWVNTIRESQVKKSEPLGLYLKNVQLGHKDYTYKDSIFERSVNEIENETDNTKSQIEVSEEDSRDLSLDNKNRKDAIRMVGYDPFQDEREEDKRNLYNRLVDFLDESTLEDPFKLQAVIEIVKIFNQVDKINASMANIEPAQISQNTGGYKGLIDAKKNLLSSALAIAKDNGISVNHNNKKSKGAGTLSGIIKQLHEIGISSAEINLFDIETAAGMKQVADISNKSIMEQLMLNENDYTEMIAEQRDMIVKMQERLDQLEEENRLMKIELRKKENKASDVIIDV